MRRWISIAFLFIFLLNVVGSYGIFWLLIRNANASMLQKLDQEAYDKDETVLIKVPLGLPYAQDDADYTRIDGSFQYHGEFYKLVKQKLQQDTLFIVCIKDKAEKKIFDLMSDFLKVSHNSPTASKTLKLLSMIKDFSIESAIEMVSNDGWSRKQALSELTFHYPSGIRTTLSPPPESLS